MALYNNKQTDLWFTVGPSSVDHDVIRDVILSGATGARLTLSYSKPEWHIIMATTMKIIASLLNKPFFVVADLEGEKFRLGDFIEPKHLEIKDGDIIRFQPSSGTWKNIKNNLSVNIPIKTYDFFKSVKVGDHVIIGDGSATLIIESTSDEEIETRAIGSGIINPNRGIALQSTTIQPKSFTEKDKNDLKELLGAPALNFKNESIILFDAIALSFVSSPKVIKDARTLINEYGCNIPIIAKIETQEGINNIDSIAKEADYLLVARGDLSLFTSWVELYGQVECIRKAALTHNKKWIIATQVAEGMEKYSIPTRAEICDLSHWLSNGLNGVLVSYETAFGSKPIDVIKCIKMIINRWAQP